MGNDRKNNTLVRFGLGFLSTNCRVTSLQSPHTTADTGIKPCNPREEFAQPRPMATPRSAFEDRLRFKGAVAKVVGNGGVRLRRGADIGSGGEVNAALGGWMIEGLPSVDLAHADLA